MSATLTTAVSPLEQQYGVFYEETIDGAKDAGQLMQDMNRTHQILSGLGVVLRIISGNAALRDEYDPADGGTPPLTALAESQLVTMAAALCEQVRDQLETRASIYNEAQRTRDAKRSGGAQ